MKREVIAEIKALLAMNDITYEKLGRRVGYAAGTIKQALSAKPSPYVEAALYKELGIDPDSITAEPRFCTTTYEIGLEAHKQLILKGLYYEDVARMTGFSIATVNRTMRAKKYYLSINAYRRVADALGIPHDIKTEKDVIA